LSDLANHAAPDGSIWPKDGCASIACAAMAAERLSSPGLATPRISARGPRFAHSSRGKKVSPPPSSATLRPEEGASSIAFGLQIAIEAAVVAGSNS